MEAEARYTWVGAAVLALLVALVAALIWLRNAGGDDRYTRYAIHFENQPLDGMEVGADVTLRGIRVGRVEQYALSPSEFGRVRVQVRVDRNAPVRTETVAVVTRNFVTGISAITLVSGHPPGDPLVKVPEGETLPVIREGRSDLQEITGRVNRMGDMATVAIGNLNELLAPDNRATFMATVANVRDLAGGINQRLDSIDSALTRTSQAAAEVGRAATQATVAVRQIGGAAAGVGQAAISLSRAGDRVANVAEQSGQQLTATLASTQQAVADVRRALTQVSKAVDVMQQQASTTAGRLEQSAVGVDDQLSAATAELRLTLETATRVFDRLREPRAALLGPGEAQLGPGEKKP